VEFGVEIGEYHGAVRVPRRVFQRLLPERPTPERCVEAYYLQRTRLESIAERKIRRRQLTEDGNVEIGGRDLRWVPLPGFGAIVGKYIARSMAPWRILSILEADPITLGSQEENLCSCGRYGSLRSS
jgi:hypothetical protein